MVAPKLLSILGVAAMVTQTLAGPVVDPRASSIYRRDEESGMLILDQYEAGNGTMTWYGYDDALTTPAEPEAPALERRCGSNRIACFISNWASVEICVDLVEQLNFRYQNVLPVSPRSVCYGLAGGERCCVSWAKNVSGLKQGWLVAAADSTIRNCRTSFWDVSGKSHDTKLGNTCTTQCLSNRPDGCKD